MSKAQKLVVDQLIEDFQNRPNDFACDEYCLHDTKTDISYWIANTWFDTEVYTPYKMWLGFYHGPRLRIALNKWKAANMISKSVGESN